MPSALPICRVAVKVIGPRTDPRFVNVTVQSMLPLLAFTMASGLVRKIPSSENMQVIVSLFITVINNFIYLINRLILIITCLAMINVFITIR